MLEPRARRTILFLIDTLIDAHLEVAHLHHTEGDGADVTAPLQEMIRREIQLREYLAYLTGHLARPPQVTVPIDSPWYTGDGLLSDRRALHSVD